MNPEPAAKPRRIYVAGPMQGIPHFNFPAFNAVAWAMRGDGHEVFNPAEKDIERHAGTDIAADNAAGSLADAKANHGFSLRQALAEDCEYICKTADTVVFLPGWEKSNGAQAEHRLAVALQSEGVECIYLHKDVVEAMQMAHAVAHAK